MNVVRKIFTDKSTIGELSIDGEHFCYTLELPWMDGANIHQKSAILPGTYEVIIDFSPHHQRLWPHILNVPGRDDIRIDIANYPSEILGCIAVGYTKGEDYIGESKLAWNALFTKIQDSLKQGKVYISIS